MIDRKLALSRVIAIDLKKNSSNQKEEHLVKNNDEVSANKPKIEKEEKIPLFYPHKIRAPRYEYF